MKRLTQRLDYNYEYEYGSIGIACDDEQYLEKVYNKLGQLEDLEEELGIDLITLFKALNSCWFKYNFEIIGDIRPSLRFINGEWCLISNIERIAFSYPLRLYGKTWSLTKEELENE